MATIPFSARTRVPDGILFRELDGESVILSLDSETYFGLDEVGTRTWELLRAGPTIQAAYEVLCAEYDVGGEQLRRDLQDLLEELITHKLIEVDAP
jgi:hypothetical protein